VFNKLVNDIFEDRTSVDFSSYDYIDPEYVKSLERDEYFVKQDIKIELQQALETTSKSTEIGFSENEYLNSSKGSNGTRYVEICSSQSTLELLFLKSYLDLSLSMKVIVSCLFRKMKKFRS
jgi:hypothetical protein